MNPVLVAILVYALCVWAGLPGWAALYLAVGAFILESLGSLVKWANEWNARKLKELTK